MKKVNTIKQMEKEKSKFDRDNTLIWVCCTLLAICAFQMFFTLKFKQTIREQEVVIKKLELTQRNTAEIDSLKNVIKDLEEFAADSDERCAIQMDQMYSKLISDEFIKNNQK
jgi:hypothetical protein